MIQLAWTCQRLCCSDGQCRPPPTAPTAVRDAGDARVQPAVPADQGADHCRACRPASGSRASRSRARWNWRRASGSARARCARRSTSWPPRTCVVRRQGKGTFVATHAEQHVQYRFLRLMPDERRARQRGPASARLLDCRRMRAAGRGRARAGAARGRPGGAGAPPAVLRRRAGRARRHLAARRAVQGPDGRAAGRLPRPDVRAVRDRVRRAHDPRRGEDPRRRCRRGSRPRCCRSTPATPLLSVERLSLHLRRQAGGAAPRPVPHRHAPLPQRAELSGATSSSRARAWQPLLHCNRIFGCLHFRVQHACRPYESHAMTELAKTSGPSSATSMRLDRSAQLPAAAGGHGCRSCTASAAC